MTNLMMTKENVGNMYALFIKSHLIKSTNMQVVCGQDVMRRQKDSNTMLRNMGRSILRLYVRDVKQVFLKLTNLRNTIKSVGTKLQSLHVTSAQIQKGQVLVK